MLARLREENCLDALVAGEGVQFPQSLPRKEQVVGEPLVERQTDAKGCLGMACTWSVIDSACCLCRRPAVPKEDSVSRVVTIVVGCKESLDERVANPRTACHCSL